MAATAAAVRKRTAKMVAPESTKTYGMLQLLPAGAPEIVSAVDDEFIAAAAMGDPVKKKAPPPAKPKKAAGKPPAAKKPAAGKKPAKGGGKPGKKNPKPATSAKSKEKPESYMAPNTSNWGSQKSHSTGREGDPDVAYAFTVVVDSITYAMFSEISGLSWKAEPIPIREGGNNEYGLNMRGSGKFEPLTLKRGWFASTGEFFDMLKDSLEGSAERAGDGTNKKDGGHLHSGRVNIAVNVLNRKYEVIGEYAFKNAFIIEYSGPSLNSMSGQVGFEQIRMAYDYFTYTPK